MFPLYRQHSPTLDQTLYSRQSGVEWYIGFQWSHCIVSIAPLIDQTLVGKEEHLSAPAKQGDTWSLARRTHRLRPGFAARGQPPNDSRQTRPATPRPPGPVSSLQARRHHLAARGIKERLVPAGRPSNDSRQTRPATPRPPGPVSRPEAITWPHVALRNAKCQPLAAGSVSHLPI